MTVIALGYREDFAFIATDAGGLDDEGRILALQRKLVPIEHLNAVVAVSGVASDHLLTELSTTSFTDPIVFVRSLAELAAEIREELSRPGASEHGETLTMFYVALFDWARGAPRAYCIHPEDYKLHGFAPIKISETSTLFKPSFPHQRWPRNTFDPLTDSKKLAPMFHGYRTRSGQAVAAGWLDLALISRHGIKIVQVERWNDRVGSLPQSSPVAHRAASSTR